jgi:hypothetical protein
MGNAKDDILYIRKKMALPVAMHTVKLIKLVSIVG